ncbi:hypothetical protein FIU97_05385 [Roseivivax sp. THAF40]|uniref:DUF2927 domain-containing protein n=1 Tax=unclassified Roseivivax TaxID=2639302 RepID=UPI001268D47F|nr:MULTISPECIES: DUF2927 domain-containing protein [unclassified Roseivivax]QFS82206.1 hypothetical protein FIV09_05125 [Roseivivax sp. THAF197b]QFT46006.1 hypothetical protein FIU97_05385 [Roseivivax sp. THAF40]
MRHFIIPICLLLSACVPVSEPDTTTRAAIVSESTLPPMKRFQVPRPVPAQASNREIARDFLALSFSLESGRELERFTRFEGPINVRVTGRPPASLFSDLDQVLYRLRTEARIDVARDQSGPAHVTIEAVPRSEIRRYLPQAACFVVPNVSSLAEYGRVRRTAQINWSNMVKRDRVAVFLPGDASPQEVRDCLHEELAQALGPLNDLYRLPDSVFNDDNVHTVLTGFDMLILRAYYDPELRSGMTKGAVASRLPAILARLNPGGTQRQTSQLQQTPRAWVQAVQAALGPGTKDRKSAAREALQIANALGWRDHRLGFSHYAMGRITQSQDIDAALKHFQAADRYFAASPRTSLHRAYVASQLAAHAIARNQPEQALAVLSPQVDVAARHENAALLATLLMLRAEALELSGRAAEGRQVRLDSLGWARYGFGSDYAVRAKLREIEALNPLKGRIGRL